MELNLTRLRRFLSVYRNESFSPAAEDLAMTHSALTKSIQALETEIGTALFERSTRQVVATEAGHRLAAKAQELLAFSDQVREETLSHHPHLRLIAGPAVIDGPLAPALVALQRSQPEARVTVETMPPDVATVRLLRREVHALFYHSMTVASLPSRGQLKVREIIDEPYVVALRSDHPAYRHGGSMDDLLQYRWAVPGFDRLYQSAMAPDREEAFRKAGFPHYRVLNTAACLSLAADGDAITLVPRSFALGEALASGLVTMPISHAPRYAVSAVTLTDAPRMIALDALIAALARE
ncbi:LysR family transcriptional regulator [Tsuneonella mangrovi]|uniref:LysR family transcriptional regulator n=1 Tax=Tsuneonella mangrovi TaxID=1982042 RepID=UPI000BA29022|nr:LysR family transcriptional regulator [Tsuneonella mangrovi]